MFKFRQIKSQDFTIMVSGPEPKGSVYRMDAVSEPDGKHQYIAFWMTGSFRRVGSDGVAVFKKAGDLGEDTVPAGPLEFMALEDGSSHACLRATDAHAKWKFDVVKLAEGETRKFTAGERAQNFYVGVGQAGVNGNIIAGADQMIRLGAGKTAVLRGSTSGALLLHLWMENV